MTVKNLAQDTFIWYGTDRKEFDRLNSLLLAEGYKQFSIHKRWHNTLVILNDKEFMTLTYVSSKCDIQSTKIEQNEPPKQTGL